MSNKEHRLIYREAFQDENTVFEDMLFENCSEYIMDIKENGETASMLFALPCKFISPKAERQAIYIYAAATKKSYRSKGYMARLLEQAKEKNKLIFLRPASENLEKYYSKFGFEKIDASASSGENRLLPELGYKSLADLIKPDLSDDKFTMMYYSYNGLKIKEIEFIYSMD